MATLTMWGQNARMKEATGAKLMIHQDDAPMLKI